MKQLVWLIQQVKVSKKMTDQKRHKKGKKENQNTIKSCDQKGTQGNQDNTGR